MQKVGATAHATDRRVHPGIRTSRYVAILVILGAVALGAGIVLVLSSDVGVAEPALDRSIRTLRDALERDDVEEVNRLVRETTQKGKVIYELLMETAEWDDEIGEWARQRIQADTIWMIQFVDRKSEDQTPVGTSYQETKELLRTILRQRPRRPGGNQ